MIFVQIAAYRDPELVPTIIDCMAKARYRRNLTFGICWQKHANDRSLNDLKSLKGFRVDELPWQESQGLCWARSRIQKLYSGEEFTLQIDSHHRFIEDWDIRLMKAMELTGSRKPLVTTYVGAYEPRTNERKDNDAFKMVADKFTAAGTIRFRPEGIPGWQDMTGPVRARFVSGHFFFTIGRHCEEYKYDPNLYFAGDEISLSIRSFTLGYDLFHPHQPILWHEYSRKGRVKHWDDHIVANKGQITTPWHDRDAVSLRRLRKMLREEENDEDITGYGLGDVRSHADYERYAGIDFARRRLHRETLAGMDPPCSYVNHDLWEEAMTSKHSVTLRWKREDIERCDDCKFIYFGIEDDAGQVLHRYDAPPDSPEAQFQINEKIVEFHASSKPAKLVIWPVSHSRKWLNKVVYQL